jgi:hypothetical protein
LLRRSKERRELRTLDAVIRDIEKAEVSAGLPDFPPQLAAAG